jgi:hypothetical protein
MMGRQRKIPPIHRLFVVASTPEEADAQRDLLEDMKEKMKNRTGRKYRLDHYAVAFTAAEALPPEPKSKRRSSKQRRTLPRDCIGRKPIRTKDGIELAGFNPDDLDPKTPKYDLRAAQALQHALAWRGERVTLSNAVKIMQRARKLLSRKP